MHRILSCLPRSLASTVRQAATQFAAASPSSAWSQFLLKSQDAVALGRGVRFTGCGVTFLLIKNPPRVTTARWQKNAESSSLVALWVRASDFPCLSKEDGISCRTRDLASLPVLAMHGVAVTFLGCGGGTKKRSTTAQTSVRVHVLCVLGAFFRRSR